eukprot:2375319-Amphidinium_carterae.1
MFLACLGNRPTSKDSVCDALRFKVQPTRGENKKESHSRKLDDIYVYYGYIFRQASSSMHDDKSAVGMPCHFIDAVLVGKTSALPLLSAPKKESRVRRNGPSMSFHVPMHNNALNPNKQF